MRIIHGQDYYDGAHAGIDPEIVFVRDGRDLPATSFEDFPFEPRNRTTRDIDGWSLTLAYVFFCGEVFPVMRAKRAKAEHELSYARYRDIPRAGGHEFYFEEDTSFFSRPKAEPEVSGGARRLFDAGYHPGGGTPTADHDVVWVYDREEAMAYLDETIAAEADDVFSRPDSFRTKIDFHFANRNPRWAQWLIERRIVVGFLQGEATNSGSWDDVRDFDTQRHHLVLNSDLLRRVDFYKVKDAFTAFQDIQSFVGGVLPANAAETVALSDHSKIQKAGFDTVTSFRKAPGKKRRRA